MVSGYTEKPLSFTNCSVIHYRPSNLRLQYVCGKAAVNEEDNAADCGILQGKDGNTFMIIRLIRLREFGFLWSFFKRFYKCSKNFFIKIYTSHIFPVLSYGSPIWSQVFRINVNAIKKVKRRFTTHLFDGNVAPYISIVCII